MSKHFVVSKIIYTFASCLTNKAFYMDANKKTMLLDLIRKRFIGYPNAWLIKFFNHCGLSFKYFTFYDLDDCDDCMAFFNNVCPLYISFTNYKRAADEYIAIYGKRIGIVAVSHGLHEVTAIHDMAEFINSNWDDVVYPKIVANIDWFVQNELTIFAKWVKDYEESKK